MRIALLLAGLVTAIALAANPALACKGKTEIFNVDLNDEDALVTAGDVQFSDGKMTVKLGKKSAMFATLPDDITDSDIDLCVTFKLLKEASPDAGAGLTFWEDGDVKYVGMVFSKSMNSSISIKTSKGWKSVTSDKKGDYKKDVENTMRVTLKGNEGMAYLNDKQFAKFKRKDALDSYTVGLFLQNGDWEVSKFAGTSVDE